MEKTIRESLKDKFDKWLDKRCDKGVDTYGHELDDCPDEKFDWRDMLIEELLDGLQYQEKEIRILKKENQKLRDTLDFLDKAREVVFSRNTAILEHRRCFPSPFEEQIRELEIGVKVAEEKYFMGHKYVSEPPNPIAADPLDPRTWGKPPYADLDD